MSNVKVGKRTEDEEAEELENLIEEMTKEEEVTEVERDGATYLVRQLQGMSIETRIK